MFFPILLLSNWKQTDERTDMGRTDGHFNHKITLQLKTYKNFNFNCPCGLNLYKTMWQGFKRKGLEASYPQICNQIQSALEVGLCSDLTWEEYYPVSNGTGIYIHILCLSLCSSISHMFLSKLLLSNIECKCPYYLNTSHSIKWIQIR